MSSFLSPPRKRNLCLDACFDHGTGWQTIACASAFDGQDLRYSCHGAGTDIDPVTGQLNVPTGRPHDGERIFVQATNGAGSAEIDLHVTVEDDGRRAETTLQHRVTVDGVTFFFDQPVEIGRFLGGAAGVGDPFVIGPVRLVSYDPEPGVIMQTNGRERSINGAMLNPPCSRTTGFDSRAHNGAYDPALNAGLRLPLDLVPGDSLIVARSNPNFPDDERTMFERFVVLTCLAEAPFEDSFRPPYSGAEQPLWRLSDVRTDRLPLLAPSGTAMAALSLPRLEARFARFVLDIVPHWNRRYLNTPGHPPLYGRDVCADEAAAYLWVGSDRPLQDKADIVLGLVQRSIDRYGVLRSALAQGFRPWAADGAHHSGRKFSILFGGQLLNEPAMLSIMDQLEAVTGRFHEDEMTFYVSQTEVEATNGPDWAPRYPDRPNLAYTPGMIGMPDWTGFRDPSLGTASWTGNPYRISGNANSQHAQVLMILAMGLREAWGHDAYIDYHMRFTEIMSGRPDPFRFRGGSQALYNPIIDSRHSDRWPAWMLYWEVPEAYDMLIAHRDQYYSYPWD